MTYLVSVEPSAKRDLKQLPPNIRKRCIEVAMALSVNPRPFGSNKLEGSKRNGYRIRVGRYRILYTIDDESAEVGIYKIGHRSSVYEDI